MATSRREATTERYPQAVHPKIYPNLNPSAAAPVDRDQIFTLSHFSDHYRMRRGQEHGQYVPNARFTFVKLTSGETLLHQRFRHSALAEGRPVLYAGEASFNNGRLQWWSNGSGNYRPDPDHAAQAGLPLDNFFTYDQVLKGIHTQPKQETASKRGAEAQPAAAGVQAKPGPFAIPNAIRTPSGAGVVPRPGSRSTIAAGPLALPGRSPQR
jgi:hypothetical protein